jgi:hypothetical protein
MKDDPNYQKRKKSKFQEKRVAKKLGGKVQKGSGALVFHKGDVKTTELLTECKRTEQETIRVDKKWLIKISREAMGSGRVPALSLEFNAMPPLIEKDWVAVPAPFLKELIDWYKEQGE